MVLLIFLALMTGIAVGFALQWFWVVVVWWTLYQFERENKLAATSIHGLLIGVIARFFVWVIVRWDNDAVMRFLRVYVLA